MDKECKCCYRHCRYENNIITDEQLKLAYKNGTKYYHEECWATKQNIDKAIDLVRHYLFSNATIPSITAAVNDAVFKRGNPSDYVVYAIKFEIEWGGREINGRKFPQMKSIFALPYLLDNRIVKESYKKHIAKALGNVAFSIEGEANVPSKITKTKDKSELEEMFGI